MKHSQNSKIKLGNIVSTVFSIFNMNYYGLRESLHTSVHNFNQEIYDLCIK